MQIIDNEYRELKLCVSVSNLLSTSSSTSETFMVDKFWSEVSKIFDSKPKSFVDIAKIALHKRHELEARTNVFLEKCDLVLRDIEKLKIQVFGFVDQLNCEPSQFKERFLNCMRQLDEYIYLMTDFNLVINNLDLPKNNETCLKPVRDTSKHTHTPSVAHNNLFDTLSEPTGHTPVTSPNGRQPNQKPNQATRKKPMSNANMLIVFSSASCSSESVPVVNSSANAAPNTQDVSLIDEAIHKLNIDDCIFSDECNPPAQTLLHVDQTYAAFILHADATNLWITTDDPTYMVNFIKKMSSYYTDNKKELNLEELTAFRYFACRELDENKEYVYYRVLFMKLAQDDAFVADVYLLDTGELRRAPVEALQPLHPDFLTIPPFARCCHLAGISLISTESSAEQEHFMAEFIGRHCCVRVDDNSSESVAVYVTLSSGDTINEMAVRRGIARAIDSSLVQILPAAEVRSDKEDQDMDLEHCPEYDDAVVAVTGYSNRDEIDICRHYKGGPDKSCFKGDRCTKRHVMMHPDGWTLDRVPVLARVPAPALPAPGERVRVYVSHVAYYNKLFVQFEGASKPDVSPSNFGVLVPPATLYTLIRDMNSPASRAAYKPLQMAPAPGELIAALYPSDERWYRARVISTTRADQSVEVFYIDYGNIVWVKENAVRALEPCWCALESQAVRCTLAGVEVESVDPSARSAARDALMSLAMDRHFEACVIARGYDEMTVELLQNDCSLAEQLAATGLVKLKPYEIVKDLPVRQKIVVP